MDGKLIVVEHNDPNPKNQSRTDTVLWRKLPVQHKIVKFNEDFKPSESFDVPFPGDITCTVYNEKAGLIFYLHNGKKMTIFDVKNNQVISQENEKKDKGFPLCLEKYKNGIVYCGGPNLLVYLSVSDGKVIREDIEVKSAGVGGNLSIKHCENGWYLFN